MTIYLFNIACVLLIVAFYTVSERKVMASIQRRSGPGYYSKTFGILQGLQDGLQLLLTGIIIPIKANRLLFILAPILSFIFCLIPWLLMPILYEKNIVILSEFSIVIILALLSLSSLPPLIAAFSSKSKFAFIGALRATCLILSYEIISGFLILLPVISSNSLSIADLIAFQKEVGWFLFYFPAVATTFFIISLIETNRAPFDLAESESELVAGFHVEYSGFLFALFFLAEYSAMALSANILCLVFLGGDAPINTTFLNNSCFWYSIKTGILYCLIIITRAVFPRMRIDQVILLCWKKLLLFILNYFTLILSLFIIYS